VEIIYEGKTKRLLRAGDHAVLKFKDEITGDAEGNPDPGGNLVIGRLDGKGAASAKVAAYFFKLMGEANIMTHFRGSQSKDEIEVILTTPVPLEVIYRAKAFGSFLKRYRGHVETLAPLDLVEFNLKDDTLGDPPITKQAILKLGLTGDVELGRIEITTRRVAGLVQRTLAEVGLELIDMKLEFGRADDKLLVIDELSGDTMRVYDPAKRKVLNQLELAEGLGLT
jgi:phosphoribosylaminoimidazole-succinocarboxamide synthase